jgi:glycosyltransferase involved in cell wall biosynthesis
MESFGIVLIEAMSSGLPVLALPVGGVPEVVRPGVDGFLWNQDDAIGAAGQLITVLETAGLAERMGMAGRERVQDEFSDQVVGSRLEQFLAQTTRGGPSSRDR